MKIVRTIHFMVLLCIIDRSQQRLLADHPFVGSPVSLTDSDSPHPNQPNRVLSEKHKKAILRKHKNEKAKKSRKEKESKKNKPTRSLKLDNTSLAELKKYAISSLVGVTSAQITAEDPTFNGKDKEDKIQESVQKMLSSKEFLKGVRQESRAFEGYLLNNKIKVPKDIKMKQMERIMKRYIKQQYQVDELTFESVKPIIKKVYKTIRESDNTIENH